MKKKILGILIVAILSVFLFFVGCGAVLLLAPGTEIFGIRYVAMGRSKFQETSPLNVNVNQNIYIKTHGVPITIQYTEYYSAQVEFVQNFVGFTKSGYDKASLEVYNDDHGGLHIETKEIVKWLYANEYREDFKLVLTLPAVYSQNQSLYVDSVKSDMKIIGGATYKTFSMVSEGGLTLANGGLVADDFKYHTSKMINVGENIKAFNYDLKSTGSSINIKAETEGDITATTKSGDIKFVSCKNLKVNTDGGNIKKFGEGLNSVKEAVSIETTSGDIILGNVSVNKDNALCNIKTLSGHVSISNMKDGNITAERGKVNINYSRNVVINSKVGDVKVGSITEGIIVNGRNGDVSLGDIGYANNVKVYTTTGKINVINAHGEVELESKNSSVNLLNTSSEKIKLIAGTKLTAMGLKGSVYAKANGDVDMTFVGITDDVVVETGTKADKININAGATSYLDVDYKITSTKGKVAKVYVGDDVIAENSKIDSGVHEGRHMILVNTSYAEVVLKLSI